MINFRAFVKANYHHEEDYIDEIIYRAENDIDDYASELLEVWETAYEEALKEGDY